MGSGRRAALGSASKLARASATCSTTANIRCQIAEWLEAVNAGKLFATCVANCQCSTLHGSKALFGFLDTCPQLTLTAHQQCSQTGSRL